MNKQLKLRTLLSIAIGSVVGFLMIGWFTMNGQLQSFDHHVIQYVQSFETPTLTMIFKTFSHIGSGYGVTLITVIVCCLFFFKEQRKSIVFAITIVITMLIKEGVKSIYERQRPTMHRLMEASGHSFPSGHTMMAVSLYTMIVYMVWHYVTKPMQRFILTVVACAIATTIALSRIYVGVHYPTDIIGGILCSTALLAIIFSINERLQRRAQPKNQR